jgi:hypothetical protein
MRWVILVGLVGCFAPQPAPGAPCSADGSCPGGLVCTANRCVLPGSSHDASPDDARPDTAIDATLDVMPDAGPPLPELLQQATNFTLPGTTITASFTTAPVAGNIVVAVGGCPSGALATITGGASSWQRAAYSSINTNIEVYVGVSNGEKNVTIGLPTCTNQISLSISEWDHLAASPIDQSSVDDGLASPASAGSITTTGAPRLLLFSVANYTPNVYGTPSEGPWSELTPIVDFVETRTWYRVVTAPATFAPTVTETHHEWDAALVSLKSE